MKKFFFIVLTTMLTLSACKEQGEHFNIDGHITSADSKEEFYKLKYCSTVVYMVPRA